MRRLPIVVALATALAIPVAGCSDDDAHLKELARYTPEILAQELLTVYKTSVKGPAAAKAAAAKGKAGPGDGKELQAAKKYGPEFAPHDAPGTEKATMSLDELAASAAKKAKLVEGQTPAQVLEKLVAIIDSELSLPQADKDEITAALKTAFNDA